MTDCYQRTVDYMRISITDRCNLRCSYCMPHGIGYIPLEDMLSYEEIAKICRQAAGLGIRKLKITGGEPLLRQGCADLVKMLKGISGITQVTLTTNGVLLEKYAQDLYQAGLDAVNVSLDTVDGTEYEEITGYPALADVLRGISAIRDYPIPVKINAVLCQDRKQNWYPLAELARNQQVDVRFIEMMPIGYGRNFHPVPNGEILKNLQQRYGRLEEDRGIHGNGPAVYVKIPGFQGSIGFISAIHGKFCGWCNRIRLTCTGQIKPCLGFGEEVPLKEAVQNGRLEEVKKLIAKAIMDKPEGHFFTDYQKVTEQREMVKIGG